MSDRESNFLKEGYRINLLRITEHKDENEGSTFEVNIDFEISDELMYQSFQNLSSSYIKVFDVYKKKYIDRYCDESDIDSKDRAKAVKLINSKKFNIYKSLFFRKDDELSDFAYKSVLLRSKAIENTYTRNTENFLHLENGIFSYHDFVMNTPAAVGAMEELKLLQTYSFKCLHTTQVQLLYLALKVLYLYYD